MIRRKGSKICERIIRGLKASLPTRQFRAEGFDFAGLLGESFELSNDRFEESIELVGENEFAREISLKGIGINPGRDRFEVVFQVFLSINE